MSLYDISTANFIRYLACSNCLENLEIAKLLIENHVVNYGILEELVNSGNPDFAIPFFRNELFHAKKSLIKLSSRILPELYRFPNYENSEFDVEALNEVDAKTPSGVLPFNSPFCLVRATGFRLMSYTIQDLKTLLGLYSTSGKIALNSCTYSIGLGKMNSLVKLINFYEEQVLRTVREQGFTSCEKGLFFVDYDKKVDLVQENLPSMVGHLIEGADEYIWGPATDSLKEKLERCAEDPANLRSKDKAGCNKLVDYLANYTTLSELKDEKLRSDAVKRFVIKKSTR